MKQVKETISLDPIMQEGMSELVVRRSKFLSPASQVKGATIVFEHNGAG